MKKLSLILFLFFVAMNTAVAQSKYVDSLKHELSLAKEDTNKVKTLLDLAGNYVWSFPDSCLLYAKKALTLSEKLNFTRGIQSANRQLTQAYSGIANYTLALQAALRNLDLAENSGDSTEIIWAFANIGSVYYYSGDYPKAIIYYKKLQSNERIFQSNKILFSGFLGETYFYLNQLDSAWHYLQISYKEVTRQKFHWPVPYIYIGNIFSVRKKYDSALHYYHEAIKISNFNLDLIHEYVEIARVFQEIKQPDSVLYYAKKGLAIAQESSFVSEISKAAKIVTRVYIMRNSKDSALRYFQIMLSSQDSLYKQSQENLSVNEKLFQSELQQKEAVYKSRTRTYFFIGGMVVLFLILSILYYNNRQKQKSNRVLRQTLSDLKTTQSQLIQSEKMASLGELTAGIAHEIQNPLNFVNNFSDINKELIDEMKSEWAKGNGQEAMSIADDIKDNEEKINHHGKRADAIVKGMLQHSRTSTGIKEPTDINALCDEYLRLSYHGMRAKDKSFNAEMKTDFDGGIGKINIIPQDIGRVLLNLFNNAFYACAERSRSACAEQSRSAVNQQKSENLNSYQPTVSVGTKKEGDKILISVKDNGNGIPQKIVDKIFQPFFTTKPTGEGTGLGLSLAYDMVKAHGGELKLESKEGVETKFIITLPLT